MDDKEKILSALDYMKPFVSCLSYDEWLHVGMALNYEGFEYSVWDEWSKNDPVRYGNEVCEDKYNGFHGSDTPRTGATITGMAKKRGWIQPSNRNQAMGWNDLIERDGISEKCRLPENQTPSDQLRAFISTLFKPDDIIGYVTNDVFISEDRISPGKGEYRRAAGDVLNALEKCKGDIGAAVGDWNKEAGAWIRFNPLDGEGVKDKNVTEFRYALIESDTLPLKSQEEIFRKLRLPIAAMTYSGGKSIHAIVHIDADDKDEYKKRVQELYDYLEGIGISIDTQNRNPSRLSRMPGVTRHGEEQKLLGTNIGTRSWDEWKKFVKSQEEDSELPRIISLKEYDEHPLPLAEEMISGILRRGHKMLISGASKSGKSYLLIELAIAIAEGLPWLGFPCRQGTVLYVNLEIDAASFGARLDKVYSRIAPEAKHKDCLLFWDLRGYAQTLDKLVPKLVNALDGTHVDAVIIDPIYKVINGDENNASDMGKFCNEFDKIANQTGAAVIYCHHHAKGSQAGRSAIDRASGSGVFGRDPDAQLDITELQLSKELALDANGSRGFRAEASLREFPPVKPFGLWFEYPVHRRDDKGELDDMPIKGSPEANRLLTSKASTKESRLAELESAYDTLCVDQPNVHIKDVANLIDVEPKTVRNYIKEFSDLFGSEQGLMWRKGGTENRKTP